MNVTHAFRFKMVLLCLILLTSTGCSWLSPLDEQKDLLKVQKKYTQALIVVCLPHLMNLPETERNKWLGRPGVKEDEGGICGRLIRNIDLLIGEE